MGDILRTLAAAADLCGDWHMPEIEGNPQQYNEDIFDPLQRFQKQVDRERRMRIRFGQAHVAMVYESLYASDDFL